MTSIKINEELSHEDQQALDENQSYIRDRIYRENQLHTPWRMLSIKTLKDYLGRNPLSTYPWMKEVKGGPPKFTYYQDSSGKGPSYV